MTNDERAQIRAEAVRECIAALEKFGNDAPIEGDGDAYDEGHEAGFRFALEDCKTTLRALLPKPDPAKELVEEYERFVCGPKEELLDGVKTRLMHFTTRLIETGRLKP